MGLQVSSETYDMNKRMLLIASRDPQLYCYNYCWCHLLITLVVLTPSLLGTYGRYRPGSPNCSLHLLLVPGPAIALIHSIAHTVVVTFFTPTSPSLSSCERRDVRLRLSHLLLVYCSNSVPSRPTPNEPRGCRSRRPIWADLPTDGLAVTPLSLRQNFFLSEERTGKDLGSRLGRRQLCP